MGQGTDVSSGNNVNSLVPVGCYRLHSKDGENNVFFPRCLVPGLFTGGIPVPGSFPGLWSQILSRGYPNPGLGEYPSPDRWGTLGLGYPHPVQAPVHLWPSHTGVPP